MAGGRKKPVTDDTPYGYCYKCGARTYLSVLDANWGRCTMCGPGNSGRLVNSKIPDPDESGSSADDAVKILEGD